MGRLLESESDSKSHLIKEICDLSNHAVSCVHQRNPFIDWYLLLRVEDNVGVDIIRKKYHKYALLLHPDKNKHPKAEFAFKLVSEAYACLTDEAKRSEFDVKRLNNLCHECTNVSEMKTNVKGWSPSDRLRSKKMLARVREVKARVMEEAIVIKKCLKTPSLNKEMPVFDLNDYVTQGYPHCRAWRYAEPGSLCCLGKGYKYKNQQPQMNSPIFECKSNKPSFKLRSVVTPILSHTSSQLR